MAEYLTLNDSAAKCGAVSQADQQITHAALHPFTLKTQNIPTLPYLGTRKRHIYSDNALPTPTIAGRSSPSTLVFTISNGAIPGGP